MVSKKIISLLVILFISQVWIWAQETSGQIINSVDKKLVILQDFDEVEGGRNLRWKFVSSRYITNTPEKPYPQMGTVKGELNELAYYAEEKGDIERRLLAIRGAFNLRGYNFIEMIPYENDADGTPIKTDANGEQIPGVFFDKPLLKFGLYVFGNMRDYYMEAYFENARGEIFKVDLGDLKFRGWKSLSGDIPLNNYAEEDLYLRTGKLKLLKIVLWTSPQERVDDFIFYMDHMYYIEPLSEIYYDGAFLTETETIQSIDWRESGEPLSSASTSSTENEANTEQ